MEQVFGAIPSVLRELRPSPVADEAVVFAAWGRCAGEMVRVRTAPVEFVNSRLVVAVNDLTWQRHLEELSPRMMVKICGMIAPVRLKFIEFRIDPAAVNFVPDTGISADEAAPEVSASLRKAADAIADPKLRESFLSAAAVYLDKRKRT